MPRQPLSLCCQVAERPQLYRRRERTVVPLTVLKASGVRTQPEAGHARELPELEAAMKRAGPSQVRPWLRVTQYRRCHFRPSAGPGLERPDRPRPNWATREG